MLVVPKPPLSWNKGNLETRLAFGFDLCFSVTSAGLPMLMKQFCNIIRPFEIVMISATPGLATLVEPRYIMIDTAKIQ